MNILIIEDDAAIRQESNGMHQGEIVPRIELVEYLWDQQVFIDDNALSVNITRLRAKLAEIGVCDFIETKRGMGYRI